MEIAKLKKIDKFYFDGALGYQNESMLFEEIFDDYFQVKAGENLNNSYSSMEDMSFNNLWHDGKLIESDNTFIDLYTNDPKKDFKVTTTNKWHPAYIARVDSHFSLLVCTSNASFEQLQKVESQQQGSDLIKELTIREVERIVEKWKGSRELYDKRICS